MEELIPVKEEGGVQLVAARELHAFLGVRKQFADYMKHRIKKYGLVAGRDYMVISSSGEKRGRPTIEYGLSLDCAKQLSMVEATEKGKAAREYFIQKETMANILQAGVMEMMAKMQERLRQLEATVKLQLPASDTCTILGYARMMHHVVHLPDAIRLGKKAAALSTARNLPVSQVPDPRFGKVNVYHTSILKEIFEDEYPLL